MVHVSVLSSHTTSPVCGCELPRGGPSMYGLRSPGRSVDGSRNAPSIQSEHCADSWKPSSGREFLVLRWSRSVQNTEILSIVLGLVSLNFEKMRILLNFHNSFQDHTPSLAHWQHAVVENSSDLYPAKTYKAWRRSVIKHTAWRRSLSELPRAILRFGR